MVLLPARFECGGLRVRVVLEDCCCALAGSLRFQMSALTIFDKCLLG